MFVEKGARKGILAKRQDIFFEEVLPEIIREADRLEIEKERLMDYIKDNFGGGDHA